MSCGCYDIAFKREKPEFTLTFTRTCETIVDLVPFRATDGVFRTKEGYRLIVKI